MEGGLSVHCMAGEEGESCYNVGKLMIVLVASTHAGRSRLQRFLLWWKESASAPTFALASAERRGNSVLHCLLIRESMGVQCA